MTSPKHWNTGGKMLKPLFGIYRILFAIFITLKNIACFQNIYFDSKKCSPYSRFSN